MDKLFVGYIQGVHGLRGDLKIKNKFSNPDKVFIVNNKIYLNDEEHTITACKFYKGFYLVTIDNLKNINLVERYIGYDVFISRHELKLSENEYINEDLIGMSIIFNNKNYGTVCDVINNGMYDLLVVDYDKKYMIPNVSDYVKKIDLENRVIECDGIEGLII